MEGATHFIEQYRHVSKAKGCQFGLVLPIQFLSVVLKSTKRNNFKTVAIFLIKPKTPTNEQ